MAITSTYRDLNISFLPNPIKGDIGVLTDAAAIEQSVAGLVLTKHFERLFHPEIGCNVSALLFDNITSITAENIKKSITDVITNFEPRVGLTSVAVVVDPDNNGYSVTISYYIKNVTTKTVTIGLFLERLR